MKNITAVVLTTGENTTQRALDSLDIQTVPPKEIIIVKNIYPFYKAINHGASRVKTKFYVQVDADMVLDPNCFESLHRCMIDEETGISIGYLRDDIAGIVSGVRMVRTECFNNNIYKNDLNTESRFLVDTLRNGWKIKYALNSNYHKNGNKYPHTLGDHKPEYTPLYIYSRYFHVGNKLGIRKEIPYVNLWVDNIFSSVHKFSIIAQAALSNGLFSLHHKNILSPGLYQRRTKDYEFLNDFLNSKGRHRHESNGIYSSLKKSFYEIFCSFYKLGMNIGENHTVSSLIHFLTVLNQVNNDYKWLARVALCRGIFVRPESNNQIDKDFELISKFKDYPANY